jgi:CheY-like chemotaxis protein
MNNPLMSRILIVEDDEDIRSDLAAILKIKGYGVEASCNGEEALELLGSTTEPPSVILLDLMMPVMNGWEFLEARRGRPALTGIPVIILSGDGNLDPEVVSKHAVGFLRKPFELSQLLVMVAEHCRPSQPNADRA